MTDNKKKASPSDDTVDVTPSGQALQNEFAEKNRRAKKDAEKDAKDKAAADAMRAAFNPVALTGLATGLTLVEGETFKLTRKWLHQAERDAKLLCQKECPLDGAIKHALDNDWTLLIMQSKRAKGEMDPQITGLVHTRVQFLLSPHGAEARQALGINDARSIRKLQALMVPTSAIEYQNIMQGRQAEYDQARQAAMPSRPPVTAATP